MALDLSDLTEAFRIDGASTPIASSLSTSTRTLTDVGTTSTPPRSASYRGIRGAEFRTSSFSASSPQALACAVSTGLNTALYVSSKIQTFTWLSRFRPSKSGLTAVNLTPVSGLFSATNMGATPWVFNQPCMVFIRQLAGASRIVVSVMGAILDTTIATQTVGATSTTPSGDEEWQAVGVVVTGSSSVNNQVDSVSLIHVTQSGTRRTYTLGAHRAAALLTFGATNPANNKVVVINGRTYTFKTTLAGTPATGSINGTGTNVTAGDTVTIGTKTYTFAASVGPATKATATIHVNGAKVLKKDTLSVTIVAGGFSIKAFFNTKGGNAGDFQNYNTIEDFCNDTHGLHALFLGALDGTKYLNIPASPTTGTNAGKDWKLTSSNARDFSADSAYSAGSHDVVLQALVAGTAGNSITLTYTDPNTTKVISSVSGATFAGGTDAPAAYSVLVGANWAASKANLIAAINAAAGAGTTYSSDITTANAIATASDPGGNNITLTSKLTGSAGNGQVLSEVAAQLTVTAFAGGGTGTNNEVLIGVTTAATWNNLISALNLTGAKGLDYGDAGTMTINADVTASLQSAGVILLVAKAAGTSGNSVTLTADPTGAAFVDEFGDKTVTTLSGGTAAPPFAVAAGARPDQSDLRIYAGGMST